MSASAVGSLILHALMAAFLFAVVVAASQEGATENVRGAERVSIERVSPVRVARAPVAGEANRPLPHVPILAPLRHTLPKREQAQRHRRDLHELARIVPHAPPNPLPIPQLTPQPVPQPTQFVYEPTPANELPAAPLSVPTAAVAVAVTIPQSPRPAPAATAHATAAPRPPAPTTAPSASPLPAAVSRATASPSARPAPARATAVPSASPVPATRVTASPGPRPGVPHPSATHAALPAKTAGEAPSPGPKGGRAPGPIPGAHARSRATVARPVEIRTTPQPRSPAKPSAAGSDLNARLRAMLPHGPVHPSERSYTPHLSLYGHLEPTPPPAVLAATRYIYESSGTGGEDRVKMWVLAAHRAGMVTICTGWLVRYPRPARGEGYAPVPRNDQIAPVNGTQIGIGGGSAGQSPPAFAAGIKPIVDGIITLPCDGRTLKPFAASPATSP